MSRIMIDWRIDVMTSLTIGIPCVVKGNCAPGFCAEMATGAFTLVMIGWGVNGVAGLASGNKRMVIGDHLPVCCIGMAQATFAREMFIWCLINMA